MDRYVTDIKNGCYQNPVLPMDFSDPDAIRVGEDYYLISSSFTYLPGAALPCGQVLCIHSPAGRGHFLHRSHRPRRPLECAALRKIRQRVDRSLPPVGR